MKLLLLCFALFVVSTSVAFAVDTGSYAGTDSNGNYVAELSILSYNGRTQKGEFSVAGAGSGTFTLSNGTITFNYNNGERQAGNWNGRSRSITVGAITYRKN